MNVPNVAEDPRKHGHRFADILSRTSYRALGVIVAVSGYGQDEDRRRSKNAGFDHHLTKLLEYDALIALLSVGESGHP